MLLLFRSPPLQSIADSPGALAPTARWLDLFAGTGAVGIEAISRGAKEAHFVELDPWVCKQVGEDKRTFLCA